MNAKLVRLLVSLYPRPWRERYGTEFENFLQSSRGGFGTSANVLWSAMKERLTPTPGLMPAQYPSSVIALVKKPSAFLPLAMSLTALTVVLVHIAVFGVARDPDEGATAHIWQLLMAGQLPILAFFAIKWLPRIPRQTLCVLAIQACAVFASMAPVFLLNL